jgi:hypothetical protein
MSCAMSLIALGVGYLVLLQANKEKEGLRILGQALGILIMIAAVLSSLCAVSKCGMKGGYRGFEKAPMCPVSAKQLPSAE